MAMSFCSTMLCPFQLGLEVKITKAFSHLGDAGDAFDL
jgi:hypothetical protein